jgi:hypothetical protein
VRGFKSTTCRPRGDKEIRWVRRWGGWWPQRAHRIQRRTTAAASAAAWAGKASQTCTPLARPQQRSGPAPRGGREATCCQMEGFVLDPSVKPYWPEASEVSGGGALPSNDRCRAVCCSAFAAGEPRLREAAPLKIASSIRLIVAEWLLPQVAHSGELCGQDCPKAEPPFSNHAFEKQCATIAACTQCSDLPPMFIGAHRSARCPPMKESARAHHSYGSEPHRANPSTACTQISAVH